jgi:hypothetical protein
MTTRQPEHESKTEGSIMFTVLQTIVPMVVPVVAVALPMVGVRVIARGQR